MNGGRARAVRCLLCPETFVVKDISDHIHEHIDYKPYHCNDCGIKTIHQNDLDQHTFEEDHTGSQHIDPYKQWLVELIKKDIQFASKHGKDELLKSKNVALLASPAPPTPPIQPVIMRTPPSQPKLRPAPNQPPAPASRAIARESSSSSEEEEEPRPSRKVVPAVQKRRSDNKRKNSDEGESEDEDNFSKGIKQLTKELEKYASCTLCREKIHISLADRNKHVHEEHMEDVPIKPGYEKRLGEVVQQAFPGLVWLNTQCRKCPRKNLIQSMGGRSSHVVSYHTAFLNSLRCPLQGCRFDDYDPSVFKGHFANVHAYTNNWHVHLPEFHKEWTDYRSKINQISKLLFTVDFPDGATSVAGRARRTADGDEEEDMEALRAIKAAAPVKSPRSQPRATKKRRSKSPSSSSEEEDSDDEKQANSKSKKQYREKVVKRKSDGSLGLVEVSDIEVEENEEEGDKSMDVDNKEEARNGSTTGSSNSGDNRSSQEDVKREQSPEVKEEVKQEPVTPIARAALGLPTAFTGSVRTPMPSGTNPFPSYVDRHNAHHGRHRGGRGGMNRGSMRGGGQYRGGGPRNSGGRLW